MGLSWQELAEHLGVSRVMLHYVRTGQKSLGVKLAFRIRQAEESASAESSVGRKSGLAGRRLSPCEEWMKGLKRRWEKREASHDELRLAIRVLFPDEAEEIVTWLSNQMRSDTTPRRHMTKPRVKPRS
jgi:hypothetical protein